MKFQQPSKKIISTNKRQWRQIQRGTRSAGALCYCDAITGGHKPGATSVSGKTCRKQKPSLGVKRRTIKTELPGFLEAVEILQAMSNEEQLQALGITDSDDYMIDRS